MKHRRILILIIIGVLALFGGMGFLAFYHPILPANPAFTNLDSVRALRLDFIDQGQSQTQAADLEAKMKQAGVNLVAISAGRVDWVYFPWRGHPDAWADGIKDIAVDNLANQASRYGQWAHVSAIVDVLAPLYVKAHPQAAAVSWTGEHSANLVSLMELVDGDFGKQFLELIDAVAANEPVNSIMITELVYYVDGFGPQDQAAYLAFTNRKDWPRSADGKIDINDPSIGQWRAAELGHFYQKAAQIVHKYNKQLFVEVKANISTNGEVALENGTDFNTILKYADRLVIWGNNDQSEFTPQEFNTLLQYAGRYDPKQVIVMLGLWQKAYGADTAKTQMAPISDADFQASLDDARQNKVVNLFITPSFLMNSTSWKTLAGYWDKTPTQP
jgi:hypothetical protein